MNCWENLCRFQELLEEAKGASKQDKQAAIKVLLDMLKKRSEAKGAKSKQSESKKPEKTKGEKLKPIEGFSKQQLEEARSAFKEFDVDGNGYIDKEEFFQLVQEITPSMPSILLQRIAGWFLIFFWVRELRIFLDLHFQAADKNRSEGISEEEFVKVYAELLRQTQASLLT